jgi:curved DNA-binding protein CbpA
MSDPYAVLGIPADAPDDAIRRRYLELTREFPPEQHPDRFAAIRAAYEQVKDVDARVRHRLFEAGSDETIDGVIEEVACRTPRRRIGLDQLVTTSAPPAR